MACAQIFTPIPILFKALLVIGERRARRGEHGHAGVSTRYVKDVLKKAAQLGLAVQKVIVEVADTGVHGVNGSSQHVVLLEAMLLRPEKGKRGSLIGNVGSTKLEAALWWTRIT